MANRVLLGNRSTGGFGLYVSQDGDNVLDTTNALQFDSRMGASLIVQSFAQGIISAGNSDTITHNLGYNPLFAVRWNTSSQISGGVATSVFTPVQSTGEFVEFEDGGEEVESDGSIDFGITVGHTSTNAIQISNIFAGDGDLDSVSLPDIYYAIVIFHETDFTGGKGL